MYSLMSTEDMLLEFDRLHLYRFSKIVAAALGLRHMDELNLVDKTVFCECVEHHLHLCDDPWTRDVVLRLMSDPHFKQRLLPGRYSLLPPPVDERVKSH